MRTFFGILFGILLGVSPAGAQNPVEYHVSTAAMSGADGSAEKPCSGLQEAIDRIGRDWLEGRIEGPVEILVHGGQYAVSQSIRLTGTELRPKYGIEKPSLTIRPASDDPVVFFGGTLLQADWFVPVQDKEFLNRVIDERARSRILVADLTSRGIRDFGQISRHGWSMEPHDRVPPAALAIGGKRMILARWPNPDELSPYMKYRHYLPEKRELQGYELKIQSIIDVVKLPGDVTYTSVIDPGGKISRGSSVRGVNRESLYGKGGTIQVEFDRMKYWKDIEKIFLEGVLSSTWEWTYNQLASVDVEKRTISLAYPELHGVGLGNSVRLPHFNFQNIPEEIDIPGEYYIDREKGLLYLYPPEDFESGTIILSTLAEPMVVLEGAGDILFSGITFQSGRNLGFSIQNCRDISIEDCEIANFTLGGIDLKGENINIRDCHIHGMGGFGIYVDGGNYKTLQPAGNEVVNCHIHDFGWDQKSQLPGIIVDGVGHRIANNEIHDAPHFAIRVLMCNDVIVEYNEIYDLPNYHMFDGGAIYNYSGPRAESRGVEFRYNYFHDIPTIGIYPDNFTWGTQIYGNLFRNVGVLCGRPAVMVNGGGECRTYNNLVIDGVQLYGQGARKKEASWFTSWNKTLEQFGGGKVNRTAYAKYPDFKTWLDKKDPDEFYRPVSYVYNNVFYNPNEPVLEEADENAIIDRSGTLDVSNNMITRENPGISGLDGGELSIQPDASLYGRIPDFLPPPFEKMGRDKASAGVSFEREVVFSGATVHSAQAADYNGDGLMDLIFSADHAVIIAFAPGFEARKIHDLRDPYEEACIHSNIMDVDGDGDIDYLGENRGLYWLECPDDPENALEWPLHWISRDFSGIHCIAVHDVDEDGKADIISNNYNQPGSRIEEVLPNKFPNSMIWFRIPDNPGETASWKPLLLADGDAVGGTHYIGFADLDADGHDEALMGAKGKPFREGDYFAYWTRTKKVHKPWIRTTLDGENTGASHLYGADHNKDGKMDMMGALGHGTGLVYYEGPDFKPLYLDREMRAIHAFSMADIEGDGDMDLFAVAKESEKVKWYENDGSAHFTPHILSEHQSAYDIFICDLEGDGDLDFIVAGQFTKNIVLYRQQ